MGRILPCLILTWQLTACTSTFDEGKELFSTQQFAKAIVTLEAVELEQEEWKEAQQLISIARLELGVLHNKAKEWSIAFQVLSKVDNTELRSLKGAEQKLLEELGKTNLNLARLAISENQYETAVSHLESISPDASVFNPNLISECHYEAGLQALGMEEWAKAIHHFSEVDTLDLRQYSTANRKISISYFNWGLELYESNEWLDAIGKFKLVGQIPLRQHVRAKDKIGFSYFKLGTEELKKECDQQDINECFPTYLEAIPKGHSQYRAAQDMIGIRYFELATMIELVLRSDKNAVTKKQLQNTNQLRTTAIQAYSKLPRSHDMWKKSQLAVRRLTRDFEVTSSTIKEIDRRDARKRAQAQREYEEKKHREWLEDYSRWTKCMMSDTEFKRKHPESYKLLAPHRSLSDCF
jgi:hypothetical protein